MKKTLYSLQEQNRKTKKLSQESANITKVNEDNGCIIISTSLDKKRVKIFAGNIKFWYYSASSNIIHYACVMNKVTKHIAAHF